MVMPPLQIHKTSSQKPKAKSQKPKAKSKKEKRAESREQRAESREQRAESREQRAESGKQKAKADYYQKPNDARLDHLLINSDQPVISLIRQQQGDARPSND
ncbi:hypothetical protein ACMFMG_005857 [Clarireedia jacksonii]